MPIFPHLLGRPWKLARLTSWLCLSLLSLPAVAQTATTGEPTLPAVELTADVLFRDLIAEIAQQRGKADVSVAVLWELANQTRDPRFAQRATEIALRNRQTGNALQVASLWVELSPENIFARQTVAALLLSGQQLEKARPHLSILLQQSQNPAYEFQKLSQIFSNTRDPVAALDLVQSLASAHDQLPEAHYAVAQAALLAQQYATAEQALTQAMQLRPEWSAAVLLRAQVAQQQNQPTQVQTIFEQYLRQHEAAAEVRLAYARWLINQDRYQDARQQFDWLNQKFPDKADIHFAVGLLSFELKDWDNAETFFQRGLLLPHANKSQFAFYLGQLAEKRQQPDTALHWYSQVDAQDEYNRNAQLRRAKLLLQQQHTAAAQQALKAALPSNATAAEQALAEAQLWRELNQHQQAFETLSQALKQNPHATELRYERAMTAEKLNKLEVLEQDLRDIIQRDPQHAHAYNALGYTLADRTSRLEEAKTLIEKALKLAPDDAFILDSMGWVLYRQGQLSSSLDYLQRAWDKQNDPEIAAHLGEVLWQQGQTQAAENLWHKALRQNQNNENLKQVMQKFLGRHAQP